MADPSVIEGHFRNLSQIIIAREISAVNDWKENSEEVFHFMRDHPRHKFTINDGLMGKYFLEGFYKTGVYDIDLYYKAANAKSILREIKID